MFGFDTLSAVLLLGSIVVLAPTQSTQMACPVPDNRATFSLQTSVAVGMAQAVGFTVVTLTGPEIVLASGTLAAAWYWYKEK